MKIGIFDPYLDDLGGGEKYMMTIASCLSKNYSVGVFWDSKADLEQISKRFSLDLSHVSLEKNIFAPQSSLIERLSISRHYDYIIFLTDGSIPFVLSKKLFMHIQQPLPTKTFSSWKIFIKMLRVNKIFCNSQFTKSYLQGRYEKKIVVIYPPVELFSKKVAKENIILHVGRFRVNNVEIGDYKKQGEMIEAFKQMVDRGFKKWRFTLAVSVQEKQEKDFEMMRESVKGYPIDFLVNIPNKKLWDTYNKAKIYWHASGFGEDLTIHPEYAEHFGISTVEAMGAGAVPVVFNAGGQKEIVTYGENGFLWNTVKELQQKTEFLTENSTLLKAMSEKARERAKMFAEGNFCSKIEELIES